MGMTHTSPFVSQPKVRHDFISCAIPKPLPLKSEGAYGFVQRGLRPRTP